MIGGGGGGRPPGEGGCLCTRTHLEIIQMLEKGGVVHGQMTVGENGVNRHRAPLDHCPVEKDAWTICVCPYTGVIRADYPTISFANISSFFQSNDIGAMCNVVNHTLRVFENEL